MVGTPWQLAGGTLASLAGSALGNATAGQAEFPPRIETPDPCGPGAGLSHECRVLFPEGMS